MKGPNPRPEAERFWPKVGMGPNGCWVWIGAIHDAGYGIFRSTAGKTMRAHRWAYENIVGPIPEGLVIDHLCRTRRCVNPDHLEPVTCKVNSERGIGLGSPVRVYCKKGIHKMDYHSTTMASGERTCRPCKNKYQRAYRAAQR